MYLTNNNLVYDSNDPDCKIRHVQSQGRSYAFVTCLDTGVDGTARWLKRYWGVYDNANPEGSVMQILCYGGKWDEHGPR